MKEMLFSRRIKSSRMTEVELKWMHWRWSQTE